MRMHTWIGIAAGMLLATPGSAATIVYKMTGRFVSNGLAFTFTGIGDTANSYQLQPTNRVVPLSSLIYTDADGGFLDLATTGSFGSDEVLGVASFYTGFGNTGSGTAIAMSSPSLIGYDGLSPRAPTPGIFVNGYSGSTPFAARELVFQAIVRDDPPAVPEPATWAMLMLGFGSLGHIMRARGKQGATPRVRFA